MGNGLFGGLFDFDGDGNSTMGEEILGIILTEDMEKAREEADRMLDPDFDGDSEDGESDEP